MFAAELRLVCYARMSASVTSVAAMAAPASPAASAAAAAAGGRPHGRRQLADLIDLEDDAFGGNCVHESLYFRVSGLIGGKPGPGTIRELTGAAKCGFANRGLSRIIDSVFEIRRPSNDLSALRPCLLRANVHSRGSSGNNDSFGSHRSRGRAAARAIKRQSQKRAERCTSPLRIPCRATPAGVLPRNSLYDREGLAFPG